MEHIYDTVILGGGPGGYTAALYCAREGLDTLVLEKLSPGGQMTQTGRIDNYPGFEAGIDGLLLGEKMRLGAERFGAKTVLSEAQKVVLAGKIKTVMTGQDEFRCRSLILATGAAPRTLDLPGEAELAGRGVHYCAACDGMAYKGKTAAVVGGGNSAVGEALELSRICKKVVLIHRRDELRADKVLQERLAKAENVEYCWNCSVTDLLHQQRFLGVMLSDAKTGTELLVPCDALFVSIGRAPATKLFQNQLELDESGYILADESTRTAIPGVFAVGDVRTKALRQIITAAADGAVAAHFAGEYLAGNG